jgi:hypothetical protein
LTVPGTKTSGGFVALTGGLFAGGVSLTGSAGRFAKSLISRRGRAVRAFASRLVTLRVVVCCVFAFAARLTLPFCARLKVGTARKVGVSFCATNVFSHRRYSPPEYSGLGQPRLPRIGCRRRDKVITRRLGGSVKVRDGAATKLLLGACVAAAKFEMGAATKLLLGAWVVGGKVRDGAATKLLLGACLVAAKVELARRRRCYWSKS